MKKTFRLVSFICAVSLLATLFMGCQKEEQEKPDVQSTTKPVALRMSWWGGDARHKATLAAIEEYSKKYPNVTIEAEYGGYDGYYQKLVTQLAGNSAPDIMQVDAIWVTDLSNQGDFFVDLRKQKTVELGNFNEKMVAEQCVGTNNQFIGLPAGVTTMTYLLNKKFLDKFGIPADTQWTWDKLLEEGKKVHDKDKNAYLVSTEANVVGGYVLIPYVTQKTGGQWINDDYTIGFDKTILIEALDYVKKLFDTGTMQSMGEASLFNGKMDQNPKWINGEIGSVMEWTSTLSRYKGSNPNGEWIVTAVPQHKDAKQSGVYLKAAALMAVNNKSANADEAVKFLNWFLNDKEASAILGDARGTPASESAKKVLVDSGKVDKDTAKALEIVSKNIGKIPNGISTNSEISDIAKDVYTKVVFAKLTPEQGADEIIKRFQDKLKEIKERRK